jgi:hypothetical protein
MLPITMLSAITKGKTTSCFSLTIRRSLASERCNAESDWEGSCAITIRKPRELAGESRLIPVRLVVTLRLRHYNYDFRQRHKLIVLEFPRPVGKAVKGWDND